MIATLLRATTLAMQIGIFARTFQRSTLGESLDAVVNCGAETVQFNFSCVGLPTLPERIDDALLEQIQVEFSKRRLRMAALSGTFNMIHPDAVIRNDGLRRFRTLSSAARRLGVPIITLCTGTRDPENMWRRHPENDRLDAWNDLLVSLKQALRIAESDGVTLGIEPEPANVVDSAPKCRRLLDELRHPRLGVVMDAANLFRAEDLPQMRDILDEAFTLLGKDIVLAHAKDVRMDRGLRHVAAGHGCLDYDHYLDFLRSAGFIGSIVLHELSETEAPGCVAFLRAKIDRVKPPK